MHALAIEVGQTGTVMDVTTGDGRPKYRHLADELRRRISTGEIPAGSALPSEPSMARDFGIAVGTVRQALALLRAEGLVYSEKGRASFVRPKLPVRRLGADRYRRELERALNPDAPKGTSFTADQGITWSDYRLDKVFAEVPASPRLAELLQVDEGTMLLERRFTFWASGIPQQMSTSYYPLSLVAGTPVADPANEPWPGGNIAQLATLGIWVSWIDEIPRVRMPMPDEAETLRIPPGTPVVAMTRVMYAGQGPDRRPVEAAVDIVMPGDRVELAYGIDLSDLLPPTDAGGPAPE
jgi:GntR family transcriptional regulator